MNNGAFSTTGKTAWRGLQSRLQDQKKVIGKPDPLTEVVKCWLVVTNALSVRSFPSVALVLQNIKLRCSAVRSVWWGQWGGFARVWSCEL